MSETQKSTFPVSSRALQRAALLGVAIAGALGVLPAEAALFPLLLLNTDAGAAPAAAPASGPAASPAATTAAPAAGGSPAAGAGVTDATTSKPDTRSKGAKAAERAAARLATPNNPTAKSVQQAPAGDPAGGASTDGDAAGKTADPAGTTADGEGKAKADAAPASTVTVPADWPKEDVERMNKLPDEGKQIVLDIQKRMAAGLTHAMTKLSEERTSLKDAAAVRDQFQADPKAAIAELARRANLEVFFERPGPEEAIPEDVLNDPKKFAKWTADQAVKAAQKVFTSELEERDSKSQTAAASAQLTREFSDAASAHADFADHRPAVVALLQKAPALTVEEAYRLTTYEALGKRAEEGEKAKRELAALKADSARAAKAATAPPAGASAPGAASGEDKTLSRGELAFRKAQSRLAAGSTRAAGT